MRKTIRKTYLALADPEKERRWGLYMTVAIVLALFLFRLTPVVMAEDGYYNKRAQEKLNSYYASWSLPTDDGSTEGDSGDDDSNQGSSTMASQVPGSSSSGQSSGTTSTIQGGNSGSAGQSSNTGSANYTAPANQVKYTKGEIDKMEDKIQTVGVVTGAFAPAYNIFNTIGAIFVSLYCVFYIIREMQRDADHVGVDTWGKVFVMMGVSMALVNNMDIVFDGIQQVGEGIVAVTKSNIIDLVTSVQKGTYNGAYSANIQTSAQFLKFDNTLTVLNIMTLMLNCAVDGVVYSIGIRMVIRRMFAPIAVADMAVAGATSPGYRYLARYGAYYVQMGIIYVATIGFVFIYAIALNANIGLFGIWSSIAARTALTAIVTGSGELSQEILSVGGGS